MKKPLTLLILLIGAALYGLTGKQPNFLQPAVQHDNSSMQRLTEAIQNQQSDVQVSGSGIVVRTLADDTQGSRHQKFILEIPTGQTLLIAHNIDLAPRIDALRKGDRVEFYGEYEWTAKGGVVHWTHHDPRGQHEDGWLKHQGVTYQ